MHYVGNIVAEGWITSDEAAGLAGYRRAHIRYLAINGKIQGRKIGRDWLINGQSLMDYKRQVKPGRPRQTEAM